MLTSTQFVLKQHDHYYAEVDQLNPLRWQIYFRDEDGKFIKQTNEFKCKDFFNDFVAKYKGESFTKYGMPCASVKTNSYGMWIGVTNTTPAFIGNVERAINPKLEAETGHKLFPVKVEDIPGMVFFLIPVDLFKSTYTISFLTLIIRACNAAKEFSCFEDLISTSTEPLVQSAQWLKEKSFLPPEHLRQYWWWQGASYNNEKLSSNNYQFSHLVHNNGIFAWVNTHGFVKEH